MPQTYTWELYPDARPMLDFIVVNHGTVFTFTPMTVEAEEWWEENVEEGISLGRTRAVEWRYAEPLLNGIQAEGFVI